MAVSQYELSRGFWDFAFENPEKIKPSHVAIFFFALEHCNRLGWKLNFGLPTSMAMEAIGIKSYNSYKSHFDDLAEWGLIKVVEYSKNQYSSNIIALSKFNKANVKALDKALVNHGTKQTSKHSESTQQSTGESTDSIIKQINKQTNKHIERPSLSMFKEYFLANGYRQDVAERAWSGYEAANWHDSKGSKILSWKQKCQHVWFKDENKIQAPQSKMVF